MVILKNIQQSSDLIEADYFPENCKNGGHLSIRVSDHSVVNHRKAEDYEHTSAASHVKHELIRLINEKPLPSEKIIIWY